MIRLRLVLIGIFCWLAFMLAAGRSDPLPLIGNISPAYYVYIIAAVTTGVLIVYPELAQRPTQVTLVPVLGAYAVWKAVMSVGQTIDHSFISLAGAEIIMLCVTVIVARKSSMMVAEVEESIHSSLLPLDTVRVVNAHEGERIITEEILRARQYERPLTIVHIHVPRLQKKRFMRWSQKGRLEYEYVFLRVVQIIRNVIYDSDIVTWHKNDLVVCLPETSKEEASVLTFPMEAMLAACLPEKSIIRMAHFPGDALVYRDLLKFALSAPPIHAEPALFSEPAEVSESAEVVIRPFEAEEPAAQVRIVDQQSA